MTVPDLVMDVFACRAIFPLIIGKVRRAIFALALSLTPLSGRAIARKKLLGAPNLTDNEWEYGAARENIHDQIWNGHGGVMPTWGGRLSPEEIKALAVYVHNLGGGE